MTEPALWSGEWWRSRTDEQLREVFDGSYLGGDAHSGAVAEMARREVARDRAEMDRKAGEQMRWTKRTFWAAIAAVAATIIAALLPKLLELGGGR